jgi:methyltransferase
VAELVVSQRHAAALLARDGTEYGRGHFPAMVALHFALIAGCWIEPLAAHRAFIPALGYPMMAVVVAANALRWWCIATLGPRWSARVIVLPGEPLIRSGPYRRLAHPNYIAVIIEGAALPLAGSAWITAIGFTVLNAALLTVRIRSESRALAAAAPGAAVPGPGSAGTGSAGTGSAGTGSAGTGSAGTGSAGAVLASTGPASTGPTG